MVRCIETWRTHHPGFEIRRWDESNVPADPFIDRALAGGHWSRASNAVRMHALYAHGGIYLDTDVEVLRSFEPLRRHSCFLGFQYIPDGTPYKPFEMCVASGVMGARPKHPLVREMLAEIPRFDRRASGVRDSWAADGHGGADPGWFAAILGYRRHDWRGHDSSEGSLLSCTSTGKHSIRVRSPRRRSRCITGRKGGDTTSDADIVDEGRGLRSGDGEPAVAVRPGDRQRVPASHPGMPACCSGGDWQKRCFRSSPRSRAKTGDTCRASSWRR